MVQLHIRPHLCAPIELALALLITRGGVLTSLLGTQVLTGRQWLTGAIPAALLLAVWEAGKLIARRGAESAPAAVSAEATPTEAAACGLARVSVRSVDTCGENHRGR